MGSMPTTTATSTRNRFRRGAALTALALIAPIACGRAPDPPDAPPTAPPNIVLIYVDDLGYGDVGAYGAVADLTPNIDRLAAAGLRFTDAHSSAATCTPSRYALLTGSYAFRRNADILPGDAPLLIPPTSRTLADLLGDAGYATGIVGKWHLGLGDGDVDWNGAIAPGPLELGFDDVFLIPATGDRVPTVYLEGNRVVDLDPADPITISYGDPIDDAPTGRSHPELLRQPADDQHSDTIVDGISRIGYMAGGEGARWRDQEMADVLLDRAVRFLDDHQADPFFLFFSFHDIHVPRVPHDRFVGRTGMGSRGDAIAQMDWVTGELINALRTRGLDERTLVLFTSDNGPVLDDGYGDDAVEALGTHQPSGPFRGGKYSAYEAGTRVPTIASWPGTITARTSDALVSQVDLLASLARLADVPLGPGDAPDSADLLDAWLGQSDQGRQELIEESFTLALRRGRWKYIRADAADAQTWIADDKGIESCLLDVDQLFDLEQDAQERDNVADRRPEVVNELRTALQRMVDAAGTRPGFEGSD